MLNVARSGRVRAAIATWAAALTLAAAAFGQIVIRDSRTLFTPADDHPDCDPANVCFIDAEIQSQTHRNVPIRIRFPRETTGPLPLILWSHGGEANDNGRTLNGTWGRTLARAGYIVVHMSHRVPTTGERIALCSEFAIALVTECLEFPEPSVNRPRDANAVLAALDGLETTYPFLSGRIDRSRIAVAGWSGGSIAPMALAGARYRLSAGFTDVGFANPLPKVFLALSPQGPNYLGYKDDSWRLITRPVMIATGLGDTTPGEDAPSRLIPFQRMPAGEKYQVYIRHSDSNHGTFNLESDYSVFNQWIASYALAFFDYHFYGRARPRRFLLNDRIPIFGMRARLEVSRR